MLAPRAVIVYRRTELDELTARHGTRQQVEFFLRTRDRDITVVEHQHVDQQRALSVVAAAIPLDWRRGQVERSDLARFTFSSEDVVVAVGQDGLVANAAKYLDKQPVIGIDPSPQRNAGVLVRHAPGRASALLAAATSMPASVEHRVMVEAILDDGQILHALNEIYVGHPSHQSARYRITTPDGSTERQSSSGVLIGTGTGATGWCRSVATERQCSLDLPAFDEPTLCWFVREAWPSPATGTTLTEGLLQMDEHLTIVAESDLVVFGDGIEEDSLALTWGQQVTVHVASQRLHLV